MTNAVPITDVPPAQRRLAAEDVWAISRGAGVTIALVGTGVDPGHAQLADRVLSGVDVVVPGASGNADCTGTGTALAGLLVAQPVQAVGSAGVAPDAVVLPVRVTTDDNETTPALVAAGLDAAVAAGADVVLVSSSLPDRTDALDLAVRRAAQADVVVVVGAEPVPGDSGGYAAPAEHESVIAVGALDAGGVPGPVPEGTEPVVDLVAPGTGVVAPTPGGGHTAELSGTGPAAAYVAGVAALVRSAHPELTAAEIRTRLELTADRPGTSVPDEAAGWGTVNPLVAVTAKLERAPLDPPAEPAASLQGPVPIRPPDRTAETRALWVALAGAMSGVALLVGRTVVPAARRRSWQPGRRRPSTG